MSDVPKSDDQRLRSALAAIQGLRAKLAELEGARREPIAVIGMGCRFPAGANDLEAFWRLLDEGVDGISEVPADRFDIEAYFDPDPDAPGKTATRHGGFLDRVDLFDPDFFGISHREALSLDPQQRLLLEVGWEALENAGQPPDRLAGTKTGVFIGIASLDYFAELTRRDPSRVDPYVASGNAHSIAPARLSYLLDLRGPSVALDTACSSSLVAIHLAIRSLRQGECRMALAGGVNLLLRPEFFIHLTKARMMAPDGRCKTFDAAADGYVRGEGCGIVVLKRLCEALADGDLVLAVIHGSAVNQDGHSQGLTAPSGPSQQQVLRQALADAGVEPAEVGFVEAHGTGTSLGDPIEVQALAAVFGEDRPPEQPLRIGTVKANIGHLEAAAGVAGLIKVVLALQHEALPPHRHLERPNPYIPWDELPVTVPTERIPWAAGGGHRLAGLSSFGFSGTNAHLVIGEAPRRESFPTAEQSQLLCLSAKTGEALGELAERFRRHLRDCELPFADVCFTSCAGRSHFDHRLAVVAGSAGQAGERLADLAAGREAPGLFSGLRRGTKRAKVAFLFTGQGSQYADMGRGLYESQPVVRETLERCDEALRAHLEQPLLSVLYPQAEDESLIDQTAYTQPALFALELALAELWRSWGLSPDAVLGHSVGEYVAACVAGVFDPEDALRLIAERGRLMQALPPGGAMVALDCSAARVSPAIADLADEVSIAAINAPRSTVISGAGSAVQEIVEMLAAEGVRGRPLEVSYAFHSPLVEPVLDDLEAAARRIGARAPRVPLAANLSGEILGPETPIGPSYWRRHSRRPVLFLEGMKRLVEEGCEVFVEIGPSATLCGLGRACLDDGPWLWLPSLRRGREARACLLESLARLYTRGIEVDWKGFYADGRRSRVALPTYPFQRRRFWIDADASASPATSSGERADRLYEVVWQPAPPAEPRSPDASGRWLILADRGGFSSRLAEELRARGEDPIVLAAGERHGPPADVTAAGIVFLGALDTPAAESLTPAALRSALLAACEAVLNLLRRQKRWRMEPSARLWLVTRGAQTTARESTGPALAASALWGLGRTMARERPELRCGLVDLAPASSGDAAQLSEELLAGGPPEDQVLLRSAGRYVARLARAGRSTPPASRPKIDSQGAYLITGGLGGLGLRVAGWLVRQGARHLVLVSRGTPSPRAEEALAQFRNAGADITVRSADVADEDRVKEIVASIECSTASLRGVFHAAGVLEDGSLASQTRDRFARVLDPKAIGAWNLHLATRDLALDHFVLFSSAASVLGAPGQANYAAANSFLDALAHWRRAEKRPALSINWGLWRDTGMAAGLSDRQREGWERMGVELLSPEEALEHLGEVLGSAAPQAAVLAVDWQRFLASFPTERWPPMLADLTGRSPRGSVTGRAARPADEGILEVLSSLSGAQRKEHMAAYLRRRFASALGVSPAEVPAAGPLFEHGLDSLMVMEVTRRLKSDLQFPVYPREIYDRPSIDVLSKYLSRELARALGEALPPPEERTAPDRRDSQRSSRIAAPAQRVPGIALILSAPRSGSTLLRAMLAGHPALFSPPELHLLSFDTLAQRQAEIGASHLDEGLVRALMELEGLGPEECRAKVDGLILRNLAIPEVYRTLHELAGGRIVVDKTPSYASRSKTLERAEILFEEARYIHLVRHPLAVIDSFVRARLDRVVGLAGDDPHRTAEDLWNTYHRNLVAFLQSIDPRRWILVRFEELVTEPRRVARDLCAFFGVPFDPAVLQPYGKGRMTDGVTSRSLSVGDPNFLLRRRIDPAMAKAWKAVEMPRPLAAATVELARELGYEVATAGIEVAEPAMCERFVEIGELELCVASWGPEDGPKVLCLHGMLDQAASWRDVARGLARRGYHVVVPDQRGHGRSQHVGQGGSYQWLDFVADADALVHRFGRPRVLVGHSMGAAVAALLAGARPGIAERLVLVEPPFARAGGEGSASLEVLSASLDHAAAPPEPPLFEDVRAAAERLRRATPAMSESLAASLAKRVTKRAGGAWRWRWDSRLRSRSGIAFGGAAGSPEAYLAALRTLDTPLSLVFGKSEELGRLWSGHLRRPHQRFDLAGGHHLHIDSPTELAQAVLHSGR